GVSLNDEAPAMSDRFKTAISRDIAKLVIDMRMDPRGNIVTKTNRLTAVPAVSRDIVDDLGEQIQASFDMVAVPLPGSMAQPGQTWKARRSVPIDMPGVTQTASMDMTYTYRGVRTQDGREVAVLELRGTLLSARDPTMTLRGRTNGTAVVDPATGVV